MATDVGIRLGVDGEKEFRSALAGVNSQIKNLNSEMKTVVSSMSGMNSAEDAAAKKNDVLARSVTAVKQKISLISGEYDRAKARLAELGTALENAKQEFGENSDEALRAQKAYNKQAKTVNDLGTQLNNATADLNRMENEMNDLGDSTDDTADALDSAGNSALSFGDMLKANVLSQAIVSGVKALAGAVRDMAGDFIESAANVQAEASQFTQTFGDMGDTASAAIGRVASSSGILDTRLNTLGSQIYAFARASGGDAAESMSLMETALQATADSAAYYDRSLEDTADSLQSFLKGNYENDAALGLSATETTRNAAAMDKFGKKFNDLTEIQKQQTLLQMVVDAQKLSGAMGQASREADGWENVQGNLNEAWRQFMAAAGAPALQAVIPVIQSVTGSLAGLTDALKSGGVSGLLAQLAEQFTGAVQSIGAAAPGLLQAGSTVMQSVADGIVAALPTLSATMQQVFTSLTGFIAAALPALIPMGVDAVSALLNGITSALPLLVTAAQEIFSSLGGYLAANLPALVQQGMEALSGFASGLRTNVGLLVDAGIDLIQNLATGIVNSIPTLIQTVPEIVTNIAGIINDNAPKLVIAAAELIGKLAMGLIQAIPTLVANIPQIIQAIVSVFTAFNWINLGQTIITMLKNGIMAMVGAVQGAATNVLNAINSGLQALPGKMLELGRQGITGLINGIKALISSIAGVMSSIAQAIVSGVRSLPSQLLSIGRQIIQGLINGIRSGISGVVSAIGNVVSSAVSKAKSALGIHSPSRVFRDEVGVMIARGMALGIEKGQETVLRTMRNLNSALLKEEENLQQQITNLTEKQQKRQAAEELATYQKNIKDKYAELAKAEKDGKQKILDEIAKLQADWNKKQLEAQESAEKEKLQAQLKTVQEFQTEYKNALKTIENAQTSMAEKLKEYGDLFTKTKEGTREFLSLGDLEKDIAAIGRYGDALEKLKTRGVSDSLMQEIVGLSVDDATAYTEKLLGMTDEQYSTYMELWQTKQEQAQEIAKQFYQDEMDALEAEFVDKIPETLGGVKNEMRTIGVNGIQGMIDGMYSRSGALYSAAASIVSSAIAAMRRAADIHSPSKETARRVGTPLAQGIGVGFENAMRTVNRDMAATMLQPIERISRSDMFSAAAGAVNGMTAAGSTATASQTVVIPVNLNGKQIAEVVYDPLRGVAKQRGVAFG